MLIADMYRAPAAPPRVTWGASESCLRCVVGWRGGRPPLAHVLPLFGHLGLVLTDHRPGEAEDSFVFAPVKDPCLDDVLPLLAEAFTAAWQGAVDRDGFASLVLKAHLSPGRFSSCARPVSTCVRRGSAPACRMCAEF